MRSSCGRCYFNQKAWTTPSWRWSHFGVSLIQMYTCSNPTLQKRFFQLEPWRALTFRLLLSLHPSEPYLTFSLVCIFLNPVPQRDVNHSWRWDITVFGFPPPSTTNIGSGQDWEFKFRCLEFHWQVCKMYLNGLARRWIGKYRLYHSILPDKADML